MRHIPDWARRSSASSTPTTRKPSTTFSTRKTSFRTASDRAQSGFSLARMFPTVFNPSAQDIIDFTRQLAALLSSGIPLVRCLTAQRGQVSNKGLKYALGEIIASVEAGNKLSGRPGGAVAHIPGLLRANAQGGRGYRRASLRTQPSGRDPPSVERPLPTAFATQRCTPPSPCSWRSWPR